MMMKSLQIHIKYAFAGFSFCIKVSVQNIEWIHEKILTNQSIDVMMNCKELFEIYDFVYKKYRVRQYWTNWEVGFYET